MVTLPCKTTESDNCKIMAQYSLNNITWLDATMGDDGDGMINITSASAGRGLCIHVGKWHGYAEQKCQCVLQNQIIR